MPLLQLLVAGARHHDGSPWNIHDRHGDVSRVVHRESREHGDSHVGGCEPEQRVSACALTNRLTVFLMAP